MANVGFATLTVIPSMSGFSSRLSAGVAAPLAKTGAEAGKQSSSRFRSSFLSGLKGIAAPMAGLFAGAAAIDFLRDAVSGASDLAESGNKVSVVFGPAADDIMRFADNAASSLGQTELEARNAAATFGVFGKAAGLSGGDLAGFSTRLTKLSSDMASFYNTSPEDAIEAIGAALRGESEPIRSYGVLLDDATLRQEAMRQGLIKTTKDALTPQQKVLAAYQVILTQTKDAQGDFARTSGGLANQQRILTAQWTEMKTEVGQRLLPAMTDLTSWANNQGLPMLKNLGGVAVDVGHGFAGLPGPVKQFGLALAGVKLASFLGLDPNAWANKTGSAFSRVRGRINEAASAYEGARTQIRQFGDSAVTVSSGVGRLSASATALQTGFRGAGAAIKTGMGGMVSALGGPWGLAIAGGITALTIFAGKHQEAAQQADALRATLDEQTGAITDNSREWAANMLSDKGLVDNVRNLGLNAADVTSALLDQGDASDQLRQQLAGIVRESESYNKYTGRLQHNPLGDQASELLSILGPTNDTLAEERDKLKFVAAATRDVADATETAGRNTQTAAQAQDDYNTRMQAARGEIDDARNAVLKLVDAYNKQREATVSNRRDQVGLQQSMIDAREEARKGKNTLEDSTQAGIDNWNALLDLSDQWNQSSNKVRNARGAYKDMRQTFIQVAEQMGASGDRARRLADNMLSIPKRVDVKVDDKEITRAQKHAEALAEMMRELKRLGNQRLKMLEPSSGRTGPGLQAFATGGKIGGLGTGTSDSNLLLGSKGEWMIRARAAKHYGDAFMSAINDMQLPKMAGGGPVGATSGGVNFNGPMYVQAHDYGDFMQQAQRRTRRANAGGVNFR